MNTVEAVSWEHRTVFVASLLKWSVLGLLVIFGPIQLARPGRLPHKSKRYFGLLDIFNLALLAICGILAALRGKYALALSGNQPFLENFITTTWVTTSDIVMATSLFSMAVISAILQLKATGAQGFLFGLQGLLTTVSITEAILMKDCLFRHSNNPCSSFAYEGATSAISIIISVTMAGSFLAFGLRDIVRPTHPPSKPGHSSSLVRSEDYPSVLGKIFPVLILPVVKKTTMSLKVTMDDVPEQRYSHSCKHLVDRVFAMSPRKPNTNARNNNLLSSMLKILWADGFRLASTAFAYYACLLVRVPILGWLISNSGETDVVIWVVLFMSASAAEFLVYGYHLEVLSDYAKCIFALLQGSVYKKLTLLSWSARVANTTGYIVSLLAVDCWQFALSVFHIVIPLTGVLIVPVIFVLLNKWAGTASAACVMALFLFLLLLPLLTTRFQTAHLRRQMKARDERLKLLTNVISSVRLIKMYAWEDAYQEKVQRARDVEMVPLFWLHVIDGVMDSLFTAASSILTVVLLSTLVYFSPDVSLSPKLSFTCVYLLSISDLIYTQAALGLRSGAQMYLSGKRVKKFWSEEEQQPKPFVYGTRPLDKGSVSIEKGTFSWNKPEDSKWNACLLDVNLNVEPGSLVGVVGFVGCGKSALLSVVLGDMYKLQGNVVCMGRAAYVPQVATVHNMTIRDNIVYGKKLDLVKYNRVIRSCQLLDDFNSFPAGDLTEVGEKGETLSGGQKQRISLARAVYSESDVYLLDDPLSALDPNVANRVFSQVIGNKGLLRNKTRILVCSQASLLHHMDKLVLVHGGRVKLFHSVADLLADSTAPETLRDCGTKTQDTSMLKRESDFLIPDDTNEGKITSEELLQSGKTSWQFLLSLLRLSGIWTPFAVVAFAVSAVALGWQLLQIKAMTEASSTVTQAGSSEANWVATLVGLCVVDVSFRILGSVLGALAVRRLSNAVHDGMVRAVLRSPVNFFDANPRGRLLSRFSIDLDFVDCRLYLCIKQALQNLFLIIAKLAVIGTQLPSILLVGAAAAFLIGASLVFGLKAAAVFSSIEATTLARLVSYASETSDSLTSIRAYAVVDRFWDRYFRLKRYNSRATGAFDSCYRLVRNSAAGSGFLVLFATIVIGVLLHPSGELPSQSTIGLVLSAATSIPMMLTYVSAILVTSYRTLAAVGRCLAYTELPAEFDVSEDKGLCLDKGWPRDGKLQFNEYTASYRPGVLPNVLKNITFTVEPGERVGVVGRTGAGKSSMLLALLQVLRSSQGSIKIDGVDIAQVPLRILRSAITVIPQDPSLVRGTLRENLDPTDSYSDEAIWKAVEQSHLHNFVAQNPAGILLHVGDGGTNLSVGQRQLVCLARALLRGTKLLVLDEATSNMDGDTDRLIQSTLRRSFGGCTLLAIAHRMETVLNYDKILVLEAGRVKEFGAAQELLASRGSAFRKMVEDAGVLPNEGILVQNSYNSGL